MATTSLCVSAILLVVGQPIALLTLVQIVSMHHLLFQSGDFTMPRFLGPAALKGPFDSSGFPVGCKSACQANLDGDPCNYY
jgi:hypothetical protein